MSMKHQASTFTMPVVLQNLPPAETLNQVVDNLNFLCQIFDKAFDTISSQINEERKKIHSIADRVNKASAKTDLIAKYPNKSTTVYSHCTFPKDKLDKDLPLISSMVPAQNVKHPKYKLSINERLKRAPNCDTLKLFHSVSQKTTIKIEDKPIGLGRLPQWLGNVGDCLLFNTDNNPYLKYESINSLMGIEGVDRNIDEKKMAFAPTSIRDKHALIDKETYDIAYRPDLENVPIFQVNTTLAGFSGMGNMALDETWHGMRKQQQQIAPSGVDFTALPQLDTLPGFGDDDFGFTDTPAGPPPKAPSPPPAPSGPPPPQQPAASKPAPASKPAAAAPTKPSSGGPGPADPGAARNALLDAIRGGKKLSKASARKQKESKKIPKRPMNLMDHLKSKLQARNNLMRGKTAPTVAKKVKPPKDDDLPDLGDIDAIDDDDDGPIAPLKSFSQPKRKKSKDNRDKTGLGLANIPQSMKTSMLLLDDEMSSGSDQSWDSDQ